MGEGMESDRPARGKVWRVIERLEGCFIVLSVLGSCSSRGALFYSVKKLWDQS